VGAGVWPRGDRRGSGAGARPRPCQQKVEEECSRAGKSLRPAMEKLVARMGRFASEALKIDLTGAGR
jgi:hypothetical protein